MRSVTLFLFAALLAVSLVIANFLIPRFSTDFPANPGYGELTPEERDRAFSKYSEFLRQKNHGPHFTNIVGMSNSQTSLVETVEGFHRVVRECGGTLTRYQPTDLETKKTEESIRHLLEKTNKIDISFSYNKKRGSGSITINAETGKKLSDSFSIASLLIEFPIDILPCDQKIYSLEESSLKFVFNHAEIGKEIIFFTDNSLQQATGKINQEFIDCLRTSCPGPHDVRHDIRRCKIDDCTCECPCLCPCLSLSCACPQIENEEANAEPGPKSDEKTNENQP